MKPVAGQSWQGGYKFHPSIVKTTSCDFKYSRRNTGTGTNSEAKGCNIAAVWNPHLQETLINGVLQGRKQTDIRGASALSRFRMFSLSSEIQYRLGLGDAFSTDMCFDYRELKRSKALQDRQGVKKAAKKEALQGWGENSDHTLAHGDP